MALFRRMSPSVVQGVDPFAGDDAHHGLTFFIAVIAEGVIIGGAVAWYIWGRQAITVPPPAKVQTVQLRKHPKKPPPPKPPPPPPLHRLLSSLRTSRSRLSLCLLCLSGRRSFRLHRRHLRVPRMPLWGPQHLQWHR